MEAPGRCSGDRRCKGTSLAVELQCGSMKAVQVAAPKGTAPFFAWRKRKEATLGFNWQYHLEYELTYIVRGHGARFVGDDTAFYASGDLVLLAPSVPHSWAGDAHCKTVHECVVLHFANAMIPGHDVGNADSLVQLSKLLTDARKGVSFHGLLRKKAVKLLLALQSTRPLEGLSKFFELLDLLCQSKPSERKCLSTRSYDPDLFSQTEPQDELSRVVAFVKTNHKRAISVREAAAVVSRSPSAFTRFFRRSTGRSFVAYLNEFRIAQAASVLLAPDLSVAQVARSVGFHNLAHFNRLFLKLRGETPTQFRGRTMKFTTSQT